MQPLDLIVTAQKLLALPDGGGRPRQADLRRAVSTAYYAMFHALCRTCANLLAGTNAEGSAAWRQIYRALEHKYAWKQCRNQEVMQAFPLAIRHFAAEFVQLQEKRHLADYDPIARFHLYDVTQTIARAETAVRQFEGAAREDLRAFAVWVLLRAR